MKPEVHRVGALDDVQLPSGLQGRGKLSIAILIITSCHMPLKKKEITPYDRHINLDMWGVRAEL